MVLCKASDRYLRLMKGEVHHPVQGEQDNEQDIIEQILAYCKEPKTMAEIISNFGFKNRLYLKRHFLDALLSDDSLKMTIPDKPSSKNQKYYS